MRTLLRRVAAVAGMALVMGALGGCAAMAVHPWDRDLLADKRMRLVPSSTERAIDDHIYFSKEGSTGGQSVGGGGCGCN